MKKKKTRTRRNEIKDKKIFKREAIKTGRREPEKRKKTQQEKTRRTEKGAGARRSIET